MCRRSSHGAPCPYKPRLRRFLHLRMMYKPMAVIAPSPRPITALRPPIPWKPSICMTICPHHCLTHLTHSPERMIELIAGHIQDCLEKTFLDAVIKLLSCAVIQPLLSSLQQPLLDALSSHLHNMLVGALFCLTAFPVPCMTLCLSKFLIHFHSGTVPPWTSCLSHPGPQLLADSPPHPVPLLLQHAGYLIHWTQL